LTLTGILLALLYVLSADVYKEKGKNGKNVYKT